MDRGEPGSKMHILADANGLPLVVGVSAGNVHDSEGLKPMVEGHQTQHAPTGAGTSSRSGCTRMTGKPLCPVRREAAWNRTRPHGEYLAARPT